MGNKRIVECICIKRMHLKVWACTFTKGPRFTSSLVRRHTMLSRDLQTLSNKLKPVLFHSTSKKKKPFPFISHSFFLFCLFIIFFFHTTLVTSCIKLQYYFILYPFYISHPSSRISGESNDTRRIIISDCLLYMYIIFISFYISYTHM